MKIETKPYGEIKLDPTERFRLLGGLMGFEGMERYAIIGRPEERPFRWLQSLEDPSLAMVITPVRAVVPEYRIPLPDNRLRVLEARGMEELAVYAIVVVPNNPRKMTANLRGPLIVNPSAGIGVQAINPFDEYGTRHRILDPTPDPTQSLEGGDSVC